MALINKFFSSRKKGFHKHQDICERTFVFSKDQIRLVLFRECDFRGRKLLFDSQSVQRILLPHISTKQQITNSTNTGNPQLSKNEGYIEISNGYGYQYCRPCNDVNQLGEMVFGTVAMSFRGTSLKIHSFNSPPKLMCTQVFPSPKHLIRGRVSVTSQCSDILKSNSSVQSLEKSAKFDNSTASSTISFNEQTSVYSTESDIKINISTGSVPLDVPLSNQSVTSTKLAPSLEGDSGFCGEQSYSSISSGPPSIMSLSLWDTRHDNPNIHGFSCGSLYKRWLRNASTSLDYNTTTTTSDCSISTNSGSGGGAIHSSASADECTTRTNHRSSKLGLAVIIHLTEGQETELECFLLEHSALIESMVYRARIGSELAYTKPGNFASSMYEVFKETCQWLTDLITGPTINTYLWHIFHTQRKINRSLFLINDRYSFSTCDTNQLFYTNSSNNDNNYTSDIMFKTKSESSLSKKHHNSNLYNRDRIKNNLLLFKNSTSCSNNNNNNNSSVLTSVDNNIKMTTFNFSLKKTILKPLANDLLFYSASSSSSTSLSTDKFKNNTDSIAEKFIREFCELLETIDTKHTNFFISTLLTAVLTHHLGWVSTVLHPSQIDNDNISKLNGPCNPLWGQLTDLYGAVGSPTKLAHTIVCGNNKTDTITKILCTLTYFIRCTIIERNALLKYTPTFHKYDDDGGGGGGDDGDDDKFKQETTMKLSNNKLSSSSSLLLINRKSDNDNKKEIEELEMSLIQNSNSKKPSGLSRTKSCMLNTINTETVTINADGHPLLDKITSLGLSATTYGNQHLYNNNTNEKFNCPSTSSFLQQEQQIVKIKNNTDNDTESSDSKLNVIFVLGDNDELIDLKRNRIDQNNSIINTNIPSCSKERPKNLNIPNNNSNISSNSSANTKNSISKKIFEHCDSSDDTSSPDISNSICHHNNSSSSSSSSSTSSSSSNSNSNSTETSPCSDCKKIPSDLKLLKNLKLPLENKIVTNRSSIIDLESEQNESSDSRKRDEFNRSQSVPPSDKKTQRKCSKNGCKKKYSGVKFDFKQYPQIVTNYMKSKNLEMSQLPFTEKALKLNRSFSTSLYDCSKFNFPSCDCEPHSEETLQTPSNATELAFTSELVFSTEKIERKNKTILKSSSSTSLNDKEINNDKLEMKSAENENNAIFQHDIDTYEEKIKKKNTEQMIFIELPMPRIITQSSSANVNKKIGYTKTLLRGVYDNYISDMVLQGVLAPPKLWEHILRRDLSLAARKSVLDQPVQEAVAIIANIDTWEIQLISSQTSNVDKGSSTIPVGMSQLVANMLESLLHMWKLKTPPEYCLMHIESRLHEFCVRSKALAQLLMDTEFCSMEFLQSSLQLEMYDVPLLMAVASTHTPQVTQKYGVSFH